MKQCHQYLAIRQCSTDKLGQRGSVAAGPNTSELNQQLRFSCWVWKSPDIIRKAVNCRGSAQALGFRKPMLSEKQNKTQKSTDVLRPSGVIPSLALLQRDNCF